MTLRSEQGQMMKKFYGLRKATNFQPKLVKWSTKICDNNNYVEIRYWGVSSLPPRSSPSGTSRDFDFSESIRSEDMFSEKKLLCYFFSI